MPTMNCDQSWDETSSSTELESMPPGCQDFNEGQIANLMVKEGTKNIEAPTAAMDELILIVNRLQEVFAVQSTLKGSDDSRAFTQLQLPQIVVVGSQSSGKSSVLESLVERSFLPRGTGIVTRRPLVLQLIYVTNKELAETGAELKQPNLEAWGVFFHNPNQKFSNFDDMRQEILDETIRVAGDRNGISAEPIILKIYSNNCNLTLVDLPGLIKVPVGDQPQDIEKQVHELVLKYITEAKSIILAVVTANTDIATSESLQLARQVDPDGLRTLAVVTKLDLMDAGTDATDILNGTIIPVRLGIIGVLNRSQRDIQHNKSISNALADEAIFFKQNYPKLASKQGTPYLAKTLQKLLLEHIRLCLPDIRNDVQSLLNQSQSLLKKCGEPVQDKNKILLQLLTEVSSEYCSSIKGNSREIETTELRGGACISYIFQESFAQTLESIEPLSGFNKKSIMTAMRNASGTTPSLFVPEVTFELLVKKQIERLEEPSLCCADLVHQELQRVIRTSLKRCEVVSRFTNLHRRIVKICSDMIQVQLPATHATIRQLVAIELAFINTNHPDFIRDTQEIKNTLMKIPKQCSLELCSSQEDSATKILLKSNLFELSKPEDSEMGDPSDQRTSKLDLIDERKHRNCHVIETLVKSYFNVVKKSIQDSVPKTIMHCLVNNVMENLHQNLVCELYRPEYFDELLAESKQISQQRKSYKQMIKDLTKANNILNDISDAHQLWL